ncbi:MAG TPA: M67 family metallopeptidase [Chitinophagaceae bacterium]
MIRITPSAYEIITQDAIHSFPYECCGFLYGTENGDRIITDALVANNSKEGDKRKRFEISAKDYLHAERYAEEKGLNLLGVYHSHPNHPAIPSEHDRVAAQPYFSYIIISIYDELIDHLRSWRLNESFQFDEETVSEFETIKQ